MSAVFKNFLLRTPVSCLQWFMGWICERSTVSPPSETTSNPSGHETVNRLHKDSVNVGRLFEKGAMNSYAEETIISSMALKVLEMEMKLVDLKSIDNEQISLFLDDVTSNCLKNLENLIDEQFGIKKELFSRLYQLISGLLAAGQLKMAYGCEKLRKECLKGLEQEPCPSADRFCDTSERTKCQLTSVMQQLSTSSGWTRLLSHSLMRNMLNEMCELYELKLN